LEPLSPFTVKLVVRALGSHALIVAKFELSCSSEERLLNDKVKIKELVLVVPREQL
jgi:hypothetical protein